MNKKLIALAVAGALAVPMAASAATNVTIYGSAQAELNNVDVKGLHNGNQASLNDNAGRSRWGLAITEDLGNGLNANAKIEYGWGTGYSQNGFQFDANREQWVGLSGSSWGEVQLGRIQSLFKDYAGGLTIDPFNYTSLQAVGSGGAMYAPANGLGASGFVDQAARYLSPSWGGFSFAVLYIPGNSDQTEAAFNPANTGGKGGGNDFQGALKYNFGPGEIFGAYSRDSASERQKAVSPGAGDEKVWRLGAAWSFADFRIAGQYDRIKSALATECTAQAQGGELVGNSSGTVIGGTGQCLSAMNPNGDGRIFFLMGSYKFGNTLLVVQGGQTKADAIDGFVERKAKNITIGAIHNLSQRSSVFGGYQHVKADNTHVTGSTDNADRSTWSIGVRHNF